MASLLHTLANFLRLILGVPIQDDPKKPSPPSPTPPPTAPVPVWAQLLCEAHNGDRLVFGVVPLTIDSALMAAAQDQANWMAKTSVMDHTGENGSTAADRVAKAGFKADFVGENIASGYSDVHSVYNAWLSSQGHRKNILSNHYNNVGFGRAQNSQRQYWVTVFARKAVGFNLSSLIYLHRDPAGLGDA